MATKKATLLYTESRAQTDSLMFVLKSFGETWIKYFLMFQYNLFRKSKLSYDDDTQRLAYYMLFNISH